MDMRRRKNLSQQVCCMDNLSSHSNWLPRQINGSHQNWSILLVYYIHHLFLSSVIRSISLPNIGLMAQRKAVERGFWCVVVTKLSADKRALGIDLWLILCTAVCLENSWKYGVKPLLKCRRKDHAVERGAERLSPTRLKLPLKAAHLSSRFLAEEAGSSSGSSANRCRQ